MKTNTEIFYQIMEYPLPSSEICNFLAWGEKGEIGKWFHYEPEKCDLFSRSKENLYMSEYREFISNSGYIWKYLPFIENVYLWNSITFNALHDESDIDVVIITKQNRLRIARAVSRLTLRILGLSRIGKRSKKKLCLSFYVSKNNENLYHLLLQPLDIYFIYRLAQLVPRYSTYSKDADLIRKKNKRLKSFMPYHPLKQVIRIGTTLEYWSTSIKDIVQKVLWWRLGDAIDFVIWWIWKPILYFKNRKLWKFWWWVVVRDTMLKFHMDKRKDILLKYMNVIKSKKGLEQESTLTLQ